MSSSMSKCKVFVCDNFAEHIWMWIYPVYRRCECIFCKRSRQTIVRSNQWPLFFIWAFPVRRIWGCWQLDLVFHWVVFGVFVKFWTYEMKCNAEYDPAPCANPTNRDRVCGDEKWFGIRKVTEFIISLKFKDVHIWIASCIALQIFKSETRRVCLGQFCVQAFIFNSAVIAWFQKWSNVIHFSILCQMESFTKHD